MANLIKIVDLAKLEAHCIAYQDTQRNKAGQVEGMGTSEYQEQPENARVRKEQGMGETQEPICRCFGMMAHSSDSLEVRR